MAAVYLIAGIVALIWGILGVSRGSLMGWCLLFLVVGACFGYSFLTIKSGPVPLTLDRIVLLLLAAAYVVQRRLGRTEPKPLEPTDKLLLAFLGVLFLSGCYGGWTGELATQATPVYRLIAGYLIPFALYWTARQSRLDRSKLTLAYAVFTCLGVYLAFTGIMEVSGQWWAVYPKYIADPKLGLHFGRARGPMLQSVSFGAYLGICLLAAWLWRSRLPRAGQLAIILLMPLMLAGIYFSYTRSVWMGAGAGLLVVLGLTLRGRWRPLVLGGMVSAALLLATTHLENLVSFRREYSAEETGKSASCRESFAYVSWLMFLDRPMLGVGFGQFPTAKLPYLADRSTDLDLEVIRPLCHHNGFLSILTETGLVGFALYMAVLATWAYNAWQLVRSRVAPDWARTQGVLLLGAMAVYACQAAFHELSYTSIDNCLIFFLAGITVGLRPLAGPRTAAACCPVPAQPRA